MNTNNKYIQQINKKLQSLNPYLILLFGSYAYGSPHDDSDIDLLVVTNDNFMPQNFQEKTEIYLKIKQQIREINKQVAIDLLVYTIPMYQKFIELNSSFAREIINKGKILYESNNTTMA
ncbi:MAG: nucleotidyltransferase domain-containing protein [Bacteroidetes bacterium]|nr:nucleotidyltransferase domain-containing protein [Bacteroidota bacterium]MBL7104225.1 nucleotidyltransferase domain-containing protein [Bacteroidales bacterium]